MAWSLVSGEAAAAAGEYYYPVSRGGVRSGRGSHQRHQDFRTRAATTSGSGGEQGAAKCQDDSRTSSDCSLVSWSWAGGFSAVLQCCSAAVTSDHHQPRPADVIMQSMQVLKLLRQTTSPMWEFPHFLTLPFYFKCISKYKRCFLPLRCTIFQDPLDSGHRRQQSGGKIVTLVPTV